VTWETRLDNVEDPKSAGTLEAGQVASALVRFARDAAPLTVAALVLLLGLYLAVPEIGGC
jgi:hypothetical protein